MNAPARAIEFKPAVRDRVALLIALAGASGSGKTLSGLKLARGLCGGDDSKFAVVDTEAGRAKHYACAPGEQPGPDRFAFMHGDLRAPFTPEAYAEAILSADAAGFEVILIDSVSHIMESEGGLHDIHDAIVAQAIEKQRSYAAEKGWRFDEATARDKASLSAWNEPKTRHKRFVSRLLQCRAHLILCMRADEKMRIEVVEDDKGRKRTVITQPKDMKPADRWVPICEKRLPYEMTLSFVLTPAQPGIPIPIKLQAQHRAAVPLDRHLSEDTGRALAAWAKGGSATPQRTPLPPAADTSPAGPPADTGAFSSDPPHDAAGSAPAGRQNGEPAGAGDIHDRIAAMTQAETRLRNAAEGGTAELTREWRSLPKWMRDDGSMVAVKDELKPRAAAVTAEMEG